MASEVVSYMFEGHNFRTVSRGGGNGGNDLWFVLADVCEAIELSDPAVAARRLDEDEKGRYTIPTLGGPQETLIISEPGFYKLTESSRKPEAKRLNRFMRHEVMPSIRKHGCYPPPANNAIPPEMVAITQMFDQYGQEMDRKLDERFKPVHDNLSEINSKLKVVVDNSNKGRKEPAVETVRLHYKTICHHWFMLCPCDCGTKIADENGFLEGVWEHHHQYGAWDNRPEAMIPLAKECHRRITNDTKSRRLFDQTTFPEFQKNLARLPAKQLTFDLKPPKDPSPQ